MIAVIRWDVGQERGDVTRKHFRIVRISGEQGSGGRDGQLTDGAAEQRKRKREIVDLRQDYPVLIGKGKKILNAA